MNKKGIVVIAAAAALIMAYFMGCQPVRESDNVAEKKESVRKTGNTAGILKEEKTVAVKPGREDSVRGIQTKGLNENTSDAGNISGKTGKSVSVKEDKAPAAETNTPAKTEKVPVKSTGSGNASVKAAVKKEEAPAETAGKSGPSVKETEAKPEKADEPETRTAVWTEIKVVDAEAWDEPVYETRGQIVCRCGARFDTVEEYTAHDRETMCGSSYVDEWEEQTGTVHHDEVSYIEYGCSYCGHRESPKTGTCSGCGSKMK